MFTATLKTIGVFLLLLSFTSIYSQSDCTDATVIPFITDCGTEFTLCVDDEKTEINTPVVISIFSNDNLGILQSCDVQITALPSNGMVEIVEDCKMKYTPNLNYVGMDQFDYSFDFWDVCTTPYCDDGLHIWDIISYYMGPDNRSLDVFAENRKIASESNLMTGDLFEVDGTKLSESENQNWRFVFYDNDCLDAEEHCKVIDFNEQDRGRIMNNQYQSEGVTISAVNNNNNHPDLAIIFDSSDPTGEDPDLGTPNAAFGGPGIGAGGASGPGINDISLGKVLIIAEDSNGSSGDGTVDDPDDEAAGGVITFTFDEPVTVNSMKIIDLESGDQDIIRCYNKAGDLISTQTFGGEGDNSVLTQPVNVEDVGRMEVELESSGAIDDISFCRPFDCVDKVVIMPTACPAAEEVIGKPQGDMFRSLSGCVASTGLECANPQFRMATEVTTFQTATTTVNIIIEPAGSLPIEFGSILGYALGHENHVKWDVIEVVDERYMFLEKSDNGVDFEEVIKYGDLRSGDYSAVDSEVRSKVTYYRIKSVSNNGDYSYSRAIAITNDLVIAGGINIFPQPASDELHFNAEINIKSIMLLDISGKVVYSTKVGERYFSLPLSGIASSGMYIAKVVTEDGGIETVRVMVQ